MAKHLESGDGALISGPRCWEKLMSSEAQCRNNQHVWAGMMEYDVKMRLKLYLCVYKHYIGARV